MCRHRGRSAGHDRRVREGQTVKPGELLAGLEEVEAQLRKDRAQLELKIAQMDAKNDLKVRFAAKSLDVARAELRRANESVESIVRASPNRRWTPCG